MGWTLFTPQVEATISSYLDQLTAGQLEIWQLPEPLDGLAWQAYWFGAAEVGALRRRLERAESDADRFYQRAFGPPVVLPGKSLAELERIRGNPVTASRIEAEKRARYGECRLEGRAA